MQDRHLNWPNCLNTRDLGGLPTTSGHITKFGAIIRSDSPNNLNDEGKRALLDFGISKIIDVRSTTEAEQYPSIFATSDKLTYLNLPIEKYYPHVGELIRNAKHRGEVYCIILDHYPDAIAEVMRAIIDTQSGSVLIHCHAGKDRTAIISALCLSLVGVSADLVAADYAESQTRLRPVYDALIKKVGSEENIGFWSKQTVTKEMMYHVLTHLDSKYNGVETYLSQAGLTSSNIMQLRNKLIDADSD